LEPLRAPGHDGIRAPGSQSLRTASKANLVIGCPGAGPTCSAVTRLPLQPLAGTPFLQCVRWVVVLGGGLRLAVRLEAAPDRPDDTSDFVGDRHSGLVVRVGL
jgi:hypothetical protein